MHGVLLLSNGAASSVCERRVLYLTYCSVANNVSHIRGRQRNTRQRSARLRTMTRHPFDSGHGRLGCSETGRHGGEAHGPAGRANPQAPTGRVDLDDDRQGLRRHHGPGYHRSGERRPGHVLRAFRRQGHVAGQPDRGPARYAGPGTTTGARAAGRIARARAWLQPCDARARPQSLAAVRDDRRPTEWRRGPATHSPDDCGSRWRKPQGPGLEGRGRAAQPRDRVHRRGVHGGADLVAGWGCYTAPTGGRRDLPPPGDAGAGVGAGAESECSCARESLIMSRYRCSHMAAAAVGLRRPSSWALTATITVDTDMKTAPGAGDSKIPVAGYSTPAASGMATAL